MGDPFVHFIVIVIVVGLLVWLAHYALSRLPIAEPFNQIARVAVMVVAILYIILRALPVLGVSL